MSDASHWSSIRERGTTLGMRILILVHRLLGRQVFRLFLYPVVTVHYLLNTPARLAIQEYIYRIKPLTFPLPWNASFKVFMEFAEVMLDKILAWKGMITHQDIVIENRPLFEEVNRQDTGSILIISHLGNSDVCSALAHQLPSLKLTILVYTQHAEKFNAMLPERLVKKNIEFIQVTDMTPATAVMLSERIKAGEHIVIAGDRTPVGHQNAADPRVTEVDFLGAKANFPQGGFLLASLLQCPVFYLYCLKKTRYHIYLEAGPQIVCTRKNRAEMIGQWVQDYAHSLEEKCRDYPLQWFNFYRFWRSP